MYLLIKSCSNLKILIDQKTSMNTKLCQLINVNEIRITYTMKAIVRILELLEDLRSCIFFQPFFKKPLNFPWKFYPLKMTSPVKYDDTFFWHCQLEVHKMYLTFEYSFANTKKHILVFRLIYYPFFGHSLQFFRFLKTHWQRRCRGIPHSSNSDKINFEGISLHPTEHWLLDAQRRNYRINVSYFLNNGRKTLIFEFAMTLSGAIFDFHQNYNIVLNYNDLGICDQNFVQFSGNLRSWQKTPRPFREIF